MRSNASAAAEVTRKAQWNARQTQLTRNTKIAARFGRIVTGGGRKSG